MSSRPHQTRYLHRFVLSYITIEKRCRLRPISAGNSTGFCPSPCACACSRPRPKRSCRSASSRSCWARASPTSRATSRRCASSGCSPSASRARACWCSWPSARSRIRSSPTRSPRVARCVRSEGTLERIAQLIKQRDAAVQRVLRARARRRGRRRDDAPTEELAAYLMAIAPLIPRRALAVDAGTGEGRLLDVLAPRLRPRDRHRPRVGSARARAPARPAPGLHECRGGARRPALRSACTSWSSATGSPTRCSRRACCTTRRVRPRP